MRYNIISRRMLIRFCLFDIILCMTVLLVAGQHDEDVDNGLDCCSNLFISSKGVLAEAQSALMGKYAFDGIDQRKNLIYKKLYKDDAFFVYYRVNGEFGNGTNGWTIGNLIGNAFYVVTRNSNPVCPEGINGAYDRDITYDSTFNIACHSDKVKVECCPKVNVSSSGIVSQKQGGHLGEYSMKGSFNGYPMYYKMMGKVESYLFYRKSGLPHDGWTISSKDPESPHFSVTTRSVTYCPNEIDMGYNLDKDEDASFKIVCSATIPLDKEKNEEDNEKKPKSLDNDDQSATEDNNNKKPRNAKTLPNDFDNYPTAAGTSSLTTTSSLFLILPLVIRLAFY